MNLNGLLPAKVRLWTYIVFAIGSAVVSYAVAKGWAGTAEVVLWSGLGSALGLTAASHVEPDL